MKRWCCFLACRPFRKSAFQAGACMCCSKGMYVGNNSRRHAFNIGIRRTHHASSQSPGMCYRLTTCPIKGEKHVGQNSTTTNFILSTDGGLGFHCQSTGCVEWQVAEVIKKLAEEKGPYPNQIYVAQTDGAYKVEIVSHR